MLATALFLVLVLFLSDLTLVGLVRAKRSVRGVEREIEYYRTQIREDSIFMENLKSDDFLEKYAREKYLMHSAEEQLFLIEE